LLDAEMALDLLEAELAVELPGHMRAFARAHAEGRPPPAAPLVARLTSTLETVRAACGFGELADRGLALLRLVAPLVIEDDRAVAAARSKAPSWPALAELARARDAAAQQRFGCGMIELAHVLHGGAPASGDEPEPLGPTVEGWHARGPAADASAIQDAWQAIAARVGVSGVLRVDRSREARPRAFIVEPKREVVIVVPEVVDTPAARFAVLHELGHVVAAFAVGDGLPRAVDEAAAAYVAMLAEPPSCLPPRWASELATEARARRTRLAAALDRVERALPDGGEDRGGVTRALAALGNPATPSWALWHDPGTQAAYVAADRIATRLRRDLGTNPPRGQLAAALTAERDRIDQSIAL
jgi:hypothetical protein